MIGAGFKSILVIINGIPVVVAAKIFSVIFIYSMVLVDEKDTNVAKVYGILPVSKFWFVAFRLIPPFLLAALTAFLLLLVEPFYGLPLVSNLVYSALAGLVAPL